MSYRPGRAHSLTLIAALVGATPVWAANGADGANGNGAGAPTITNTSPLAGGNGGDGTVGGTGGDGGIGAVVTGGGASSNTSTIGGGAGGVGGVGTGAVDGGIGGAGGVGAIFTGSGATFFNSGTIAGGAGGAGGSGALVPNSDVVLLRGGPGEFGGIGVAFTASGATFTNSGAITGGNGGAGGKSRDIVPGFTGGAGDNGGIGVAFTASGATFTNSGAVTGGNGGAGGRGRVGGSGGNGGTGVEFTGSGAAFTNSGTVTGGAGGHGGGATLSPGAGGTGGIGVRFGATGATFVNSGTVTGGAGGGSDFGFNAAGGAGIAGPGLTIINSGSIIGGLSSNGSVRANAISFTGGTNSLELQPGSGITGNVVAFSAADTLRFGGSGNASFDASLIGASAQYRNFGIYEKTGSSTWTFTGAGTYTAPTSINGGTLIVNGSLVSTMNVNSGGTLAGAGTIGGLNVASGGIVAPGNSIGTLNVVGNVSFGAGTTYQVEANAAGQSDKIAATGTATLSGGTVQVLAAVGNYGLSTTYTILSAAGGVTGAFSGVTSNMVFLTPSLSYDSDEVFLKLVRSTSAFSSVAQTFNQRAAAGALDASPFGSTLVQAVLPLTAPQALAAFDALSGEVHASTAGVLVDESLYVRNAVLGRLRQGSYGGDASMASLSLGGPQVAFQDEELSALAYGKSPIVTKAPRMAPQQGPDLAFWAQGFGASGKFDSDGNAARLKRDLAGFFTGFDARFGNWRGGIAAGYTASRNNLDGRGTANVETGHVAAYGGVNVGALNLRAGGAYAFHSIDTDRTIVFPGFFDRATARYDGGTGQIFGEAGYGFAFGKVAIEPFAGAAWVHLIVDAANEKGGAAALVLAANAFEVGYSTLGIRAASMIPIGHDMVLVPRASLAWQHAFNDVTPEARLAFIAAPVPFVIAGAPIARDSILGEVGLDLAIGRNATVGVSYVGQLARNVQDHAAKGKFSWKF
jgi:outer membrane autotransporter protein